MQFGRQLYGARLVAFHAEHGITPDRELKPARLRVAPATPAMSPGHGWLQAAGWLALGLFAGLTGWLCLVAWTAETGGLR